MAHDHNYFKQRAAEARRAAFCREQSEDAEVAGQLALAYAALARRHEAENAADEADEEIDA